MTYEIAEVTPTKITVNLKFAQPLLVSTGEFNDQVVVKLDKDVFLTPERIAKQNLSMKPEVVPFYITTGELPQMNKSQEEAETIESISATSK